MLIRPLLKGETATFSSEDISALTTAFEEMSSALRLLCRNGAAKLIVAKRIIGLAKHGERNPARLRNFVISQFKARSR